MASALVNNMAVTPKAFLEHSSPATPFFFNWLGPRVSFSHEDCPATAASEEEKASNDVDITGKEPVEFEFRLEDPVTMLPADELFFDGKLIPLHLRKDPTPPKLIRLSPVLPQKSNREGISVSTSDSYVFSPKAPGCSSRWRELLGLKRSKPDHNQNRNPETTSSAPEKTPANSKGLKHFLHRNRKLSSSSSSTDSSLEFETVSVSARLSLSSSSSSGADHDDLPLPRLSVDSDKRCSDPISLNRNPSRQLRTSVRVRGSQVRRVPEGMVSPRGASVESPRMSSCGKIVFQSLERSSSSPSSFNGGPRVKYRGIERSYSANVRVKPVLNVPLCSLRGSSRAVPGFGQLFSPQKEASTTRSSRGTR